MKQKSEFDSVYNIDVQRILLSFLIDDPDVFVRCRSIVRDNYFDDELRRAVRFILSYVDEFNKLPNVALIEAKTSTEIKKLSDYGENPDNDWFLQEMEKFCRYKALENIILDGYELLQKGEGAHIEARVKEAMEISLITDLGTDYYADPETRLKDMLEKSAKVSTGFKSLDELLYGGIGRGTLNIFCAKSGTGKSIFLANLARNWAREGYNGVYITLEMSEQEVALRCDAMNTGKSTRQVFQDISGIAFEIKMMGKKAGQYFIKELPIGSTCNTIRAYLKELQIKTGIRLDFVIIDYLELLHPNVKMDMSNLFVKDKFVSEEIRTLMKEFDVFGATASQVTRDGGQAEGEFEHHHIAGGISKINTADLLAFLFAPLAMKEKGEFMLTFGKCRTAPIEGKKVTLKYNLDSMALSDMVVANIDVDKPLSKDDRRRLLLLNAEVRALAEKGRSAKTQSEKDEFNKRKQQLLDRSDTDPMIFEAIKQLPDDVACLILNDNYDPDETPKVGFLTSMLAQPSAPTTNLMIQSREPN